MGPTLDDPTAVDDQDQVGSQDGAQTVGNDDAGAFRHHLAQCVLYQRFRFAVQAAGGFIQHQDARVFKDHAGQRKTLFFAAAQAIATFTHDGVVAVGQLVTKV